MSTYQYQSPLYQDDLIREAYDRTRNLHECWGSNRICGITATPPHKDIQKTALGSTESVEWEYAENTLELIQKLHAESVQVISIEQAENATMLNKFTPKPNTTYALVFGNEVKGVSQDVVNLSDAVIEIPQYGTKHSLNISVSCGVVLWDLFSKLD